MKVLWLCNIMLPAVAEHLKIEASNKEGWLSGLLETILSRQQENEIELGIAFPVPVGMENFRKEIAIGRGMVSCYGFAEDTANPEIYNREIEGALRKILGYFKPDLVHCFGTEYPHTLALTKVYENPDKTLIGIQGLCAVYADAYMADLPDKVQKRVTLRDFIKKDSLKRQKLKFTRRGEYEVEAIRNAGHITGRTSWDKKYTQEWNPKAEYHFMNETLRSDFYTGVWEEHKCEAHRIFLSQGDYPIKGLHYMLTALPDILIEYPDTKVYVAGSKVVDMNSVKGRLKLSSYGRYVMELIQKNHMEEQVFFLGRLNAEEMKKQYLKSHLFVCSSSIENSPNSLGEAMILGMPVVTTDAGGIRSIFEGGKDGIIYSGYETEFDVKEMNEQGWVKGSKSRMDIQARELAAAVCHIWRDKELQLMCCKNARKHALITHDREKNYLRLVEIYRQLAD